MRFYCQDNCPEVVTEVDAYQQYIGSRFWTVSLWLLKMIKMNDESMTESSS